MRYPPIPPVLHGAGGPIAVKLVDRPRVDGEPCWGSWDDGTRTISLERRAKPAHRWRVLFHELVHAAIDDAGLCHLLTPDGQEALCDALSSSRMAELRASLGER